MTQEEKDEFVEDMKRDEHVERMEMRQEYELSNDYESFKAHYEDNFNEAIELLKELYKLHEAHGWDLDARELLDA